MAAAREQVEGTTLADPAQGCPQDREGKCTPLSPSLQSSALSGRYLECRLYYNSDVASLTDQETCAIEKGFCDSTQEVGTHGTTPQGPPGEEPEWTGGRASEEKTWTRALIVVSGRRNGQSRASRLTIGWLK